MRRNPTIALLCVLALGVAVGPTGCSSGESPPNVVLVICDTLRADKLGCYGNGRGMTPYLDELAEEGALFENAYSHAPWTLPSISSILTSLHPKEHGAGGRLGRFSSLSLDALTIPGVLKELGYETYAIVNVQFLDDEKFGATRDFDGVNKEYFFNNKDVRIAETVTDLAIEWLDENADGPFFLLVHYFDPHAVYAPPQPFRERFAGPLDKTDTTWEFATREHMIALRKGELELTPAVIKRGEKLYDSEIAYTDSQIGRLVDAIDERQLRESTVLLFTADHGEEFLDHQNYEHGHTVYDELLHVPLLLRFPPKVSPGTRVADVVRHVDIAPTVCELTDTNPPDQFIGKSLMPLLRGEAETPRTVLSHGNMWGDPLTSLRLGDHKLIERGDGGYELYHMTADPDELNDLAAVDPTRLAELKTKLAELQGALRIRNTPRATLSDADKEALRSLGYLGEEEDEEDEGEEEDEGK